MDDCRHSLESLADLAWRQLVRPALSAMDFEWSRRSVLFWWNLAADRGRCGHGHRPAVGSAVGHAQLRRICTEGPVSRAAVTPVTWREIRPSDAGPWLDRKAQPCGNFSRPSGRRKGHTSERVGAQVFCAA